VSPEGGASTGDPDRRFEGHPIALAVVRRVRELVADLDGVTVAASRSGVTFRRRRGFAYVWRPGQWLTNPDAEAVLSIVLPREDRSPRWKEVAHPSATTWMHHLELASASEIDDQVATWLHEAWDAAAPRDEPPI
jgi:hypothetical protein